MNIIDDLTNSFSRLPGIGKKSAARIVNNLLKANPAYIQNFARQLSELQQKIKPCSVCGAWTEINPCPICSNPLRDKSLICVVEQPQDVITIDSTGTFSGLFHVLGGVIAPLEGIGPEQLNIASLLNRAKTEAIKEYEQAPQTIHNHTLEAAIKSWQEFMRNKELWQEYLTNQNWIESLYE